MSQLVIILSVYFALYGALHLYLLIKLRRSNYLHGLGYGLFAFLLLLLILAPIQARLLETQGLLLPATITAWIGYIWMGFLFIFSCVSLPIDAYHLLMFSGQVITGGDLTHLMFSRRQCVGIAALIACCLTVYGAFEASQLRTETVTLESAKIPPSTDRIRIAQISDLHLGAMHYPGRLEAVAAAVVDTRPDLLVCTGDFVDGQIRNSAATSKLLRAMPAPMGKFAITGNHEFYVNTNEAIEFIQASGFTVLRNQSVSVGKHLFVVGVDDPAGNNPPAATEKDLLAKSPGRRYTLLLKHRPTVDPDSLERFDLQLSGHTHKGQIFPFALLIRLSYPIYYGLHQFKSGANLYVNRGTGSWGPPIRLLAPPEITIIDLVPQAQK